MVCGDLVHGLLSTSMVSKVVWLILLGRGKPSSAFDVHMPMFWTLVVPTEGLLQWTVLSLFLGAREPPPPHEWVWGTLWGASFLRSIWLDNLLGHCFSSFRCCVEQSKPPWGLLSPRVIARSQARAFRPGLSSDVRGGFFYPRAQPKVVRFGFLLRGLSVAKISHISCGYSHLLVIFL